MIEISPYDSDNRNSPKCRYLSAADYEFGTKGSDEPLDERFAYALPALGH